MPRVYRTLTLNDYEITRNGDVINRHSRRFVKFNYNTKGYARVIIGGKKYFVHRLVAELYVPNPENKPQVNHIDGNKLNNCADNLEWVTNLENRSHAVKTGLQIQGEKCPWAKLSEADVKYIRNHTDFNKQFLASQFGVSVRTIKDVLSERSWKSLN